MSGLGKFFKGSLPQNLLSPILNTLSHFIKILDPKKSFSQNKSTNRLAKHKVLK